MQTQEKENLKTVKIPSSITVKKFSDLLGLSPARVITELVKNKIIATINEEIDFETASIIAQDFGFETQKESWQGGREMTLEQLIDICKEEKESGKYLQKRPPVVTILGHVDHGKTTLLDAIRKTNVVEKEAGGITQHIRAYQVKKKGELLTFIDTPGHEAFSAMRERGVSIADIAVLVVAADDGIRPQTKEVIEYVKEKNIPTIIAINKIDKPQANIQKVKQELADHGMLIEEWGGKIISSEISAKQNIGIDSLLDNIILLAEVEDFRANVKRDGLAVVLESYMDPQKGPIATVLVKTGILKTGQDIVAGRIKGRIRRMEDFAGKNIQTAAPSSPVKIIGLESVPHVNDIVMVMREEEKEKMNFWKSEKEKRSALNSRNARGGTEEEKAKKLKIILKTDVQGSLEAIDQILSAIKSEDVGIEYINRSVGNITESDIKMTADSQAAIFGFNVVVTPVAKRMAEAMGVEIKIYSIIYELVEEVRRRMSEMLPCEIKRSDLGEASVLAVFKTGKRDMIVGGRVVTGKIIKGMWLEVKRAGDVIGKGKLANLQQNKNNTEEVRQGNECGITFEGEVKIKIGDTLVSYQEEKIFRKL